MSVEEMRLVLTVDDLECAATFFRDRVGLNQLAVFENDGSRGLLLDAGHTTLELFDQRQASAIDQIEVGRRVAGRMRLAFRTSDSESLAHRLESVGAELIAGPVDTPWGDRNVRLVGPENIQLTLFTPS